MDDRSAIARLYRAFADEARPSSPCFTEWASRVAEDSEVLTWLAGLPSAKRQPNLVFAAARAAGAIAPGPDDAFRSVLLGIARVRALILTRSTQTNEVGRLAVLVPALSQVADRAGRPVALLELGASAGLCLHPDRYDYVWRPAGALTGSGGPTLGCSVRGPVPVPSAHLRVGWRGGIDLNPLDVRDEDDTAWLRTLVWPEQEERRRRLDAAVAVARREPPSIVRADLLAALEGEVERARHFGPVIVFHSAVLAYVGAAERHEFVTLMQDLVSRGACHWVSNEGDRVLPEVTCTAAVRGGPDERFVLGLDGRAVAWAQGHGASMTWL